MMSAAARFDRNFFAVSFFTAVAALALLVSEGFVVLLAVILVLVLIILDLVQKRRMVR